MITSEVSVKADETAIDELLAAALRGETSAWPEAWPPALGIERVLYHGIAGLIAERGREVADWPSDLTEPVRAQAIAQAMWEMRHKPLLADLLAAFAEAGISALLLKGSALAYDLYPAPAARSRGDSDVLVAPADLEQARLVLGRLGFVRASDDDIAVDGLALQEVWSAPGDGGAWHHIDLHWQLLNAPALARVMSFDVCAEAPLALPRLSPVAIAMSRVATLVHTSIHRAMHITSPYFVDGVTYYGGDRLIWANDIDLLAGALCDEEWRAFSALAVRQGVAAVSLDGLRMAQRSLGTEIPRPVLDALGAAGDEPASAYLLGSGQAERAWRDLRAIRGLTRKLAYLAARALPSASFMRAKYPELERSPLALLHARRMVDLIRPRPDRKKPG